MTEKDYKFEDGFSIDKDMIEHFNRHGFIIVRGLLDKHEVSMVLKCVTGSEGLAKEAFTLERGERRTMRATWNHPGNDVTGLVARSEKVVNTCEKLLGDEVYHYHSKLMFKDAKIAAPHYWHQDYGYWYHNGCLYPDMMTVFIALDPCTKQNGCLEILPGSHLCGRIEHKPIDGQLGADMTRVNEIRERCPLMYAELDAGDAIFFHSNLLHHSSANRSDMRRWAYLISYNTKSNDPVKLHHHANYTRPLEKVSNQSIKNCTNFTDMSGKGFINPQRGNSKLIEEYTGNKA